MLRKIVAVWMSLVMLFGFVVIVIEIAPKVTAYTPHDPIRINSNAEFASMAGIEGWVGDGLPGNPYIIEGYDINGSVHEYCIYIGNTTSNFIVRDCYLHDANGSFWGFPYYSDSGIILYKVQNGIITNNTASNNPYGICLSISSDNTIVNNTASNNHDGIYLHMSHSNTLINNTASNNGHGIYLSSSTSNTITDNNITNNYHGIWLSKSDSNSITNNSLSSTDSYCVLLDDSNSNTITDNTITNNWYGISLSDSNSNTITDNTASNNLCGFYLTSSHSNTITSNTASSNYWNGIRLYSSNGNTFTDNTASNNEYGIYISSSSSNTFTDNTASNNEYYGIFLSSSSSNTFINNEMVDDGIFIRGYKLEHWNTQFIDTSNTVNGKPVHYWKNQTGGTVPLGAGQVILANSTNVVVENQNVSDGSVGIELGFSSNNTITNNNASNNYFGIYLTSSDSNTIINNTASLNNGCGIDIITSTNNTITENTVSNNYRGIYLESSSSNTIANNSASNNEYGIYIEDSDSSDNNIYHNNVINNTNQAYDDTNNGNQWDKGYPLGGNYWSDYSGIDNFKGPNQDIPGNDGIGDTPYIIDADSQDNYPLIEPFTNRTFDNYTVLKQGWNLISIPLIQEIQNLSTVLQMIEGYYDAVQWYDSSNPNKPWKHNKIGKPFGNDIFAINETMGFWIHITKPGDTIFLYNGTQQTSNQTIQLHPGWNMVGYPSLTNHNRTEGLNNLEFGTDVDAIQWYDAATQTWHFMGPDDVFTPGRGYWVHSKVTKTWDVPL